MVEVNPNYLQARDMALSANAVEGASACVGDGACCTAEVPIYTSDMLRITQDIQSGDISRQTVSDAIKRANDPSKAAACPFLTDDNLCSIYDSRPYICVAWGIGGEPMEPNLYKKMATSWEEISEFEGEVPKDYNKAAQDWKENGVSSPVPNLCLEQATCLGCRFNTAWEATPIEANETVRQANRLWGKEMSKREEGRGRKMIPQFVRNDLPRIIGEVSLLPEGYQSMTRQQRRSLERTEQKKNKGRK